VTGTGRLFHSRAAATESPITNGGKTSQRNNKGISGGWSQSSPCVMSWNRLQFIGEVWWCQTKESDKQVEQACTQSDAPSPTNAVIEDTTNETKCLLWKTSPYAVNLVKCSNSGLHRSWKMWLRGNVRVDENTQITDKSNSGDIVVANPSLWLGDLVLTLTRRAPEDLGLGSVEKYR